MKKTIWTLYCPYCAQQAHVNNYILGPMSSCENCGLYCRTYKFEKAIIKIIGEAKSDMFEHIQIKHVPKELIEDEESNSWD